MLEIIWESINEVEDADVLLTRLEKAGMQPPAVKHYKHNPSPGDGPFFEPFEVLEWEPEES
jgi:hypothetical protein